MIGSSETVTQFSAIDTRKAIVKAYFKCYDLYFENHKIAENQF